jgi:DNA-binding beta-propeller fold protein YncE
MNRADVLVHAGIATLIGTKIDYPTGSGPRGVAYDGTNIWVVNGASGTVSKIDPTTGTKTDYRTGTAPAGVGYDGSNIWVANAGSDTVSKINPG